MATTQEPMLFPTGNAHSNYESSRPAPPSMVVKFLHGSLALVGLLLFTVLGVMAGLLIKAMHLKLPKLPFGM